MTTPSNPGPGGHEPPRSATATGVATARRLRTARNTAAAVAFAAIAVAMLGFFVAPGVIRSLVETQVAEQLGRKATLGRVQLNPFRLSATVDDFRLYEADGKSIALEIGTLFANVSSSSLFKRALVLDELRVSQPTIHVARLAPQRFSFSDIVDKLAARPKSDTPFLFSLNNIELDGGTVNIDDRVTGRKHVVDGIRLALPFVSNLPYDTTIFVTPRFAARVDGSAIALTGKAQPFSATREAAMTLDVADLDLAETIALVPTTLPFKVASGRLAAQLAITFRAATKDAAGRTVPQSASLSGHVGVGALELQDASGHRVVAAKAIDVAVTKVDPFNGDVVLQRIDVNGLRVDATRRADGSVDLVDLFRVQATGTPAPSPAPTEKSPPPTFAVATLKVADAGLRFTDRQLATPITTVVSDIDIEANDLSPTGDKPARFEASLKADEATLRLNGTVVPTTRVIDGMLELKGFRPVRVAPYLAPYLAPLLAARIEDGSIDLSGHVHLDAAGAAPVGVVDRIALRVERLRASLPGDKTAAVAAEQVALDGGNYDLATRAFTADALRLVAPVIVAKRDAKGRLNLLSALVDARPVAPPPGPTPVVAVEVRPADARAFTAVVKTLSIEKGDLRFEDLSNATPVRIRLQPLDFRAERVGTAADTIVPFELVTGVESRGRLAVRGKVTLAPLDIDATIDATQVPVGWLAAYAGERLNIVIDTADLNARGALRVAPPKNGVTASTTSYRGALGLVRVRALDRTTSEEFVRWKTLAAPTVDFAMPGSGGAPLSLAAGDVTIDDFYARLIVNASGRLNLQDVVATPGERQSVTTAESASAPRSAPKPAAPPLTSPSPAAPQPAIRIDAVKLTNGRIGITDNFIKPNYSATLTGLAGTVAALSSNGAKPATVKLAGRINDDGALDVSGSIDPFNATKYTDLAATAKDIELTRLTPYAVKYAGYAIDRGKLSMTVRYHIENGRLDASNQLFLDQLTFGAKVESPTATTLPVLLAVSLLKNARGEININLPISGSLSDPEFSVGSVIGRVVGNLLRRVVTSPFSVIAAAAGGLRGQSADELGYVQFEPGVSDLTGQGRAKLDTLAKALADRPTLRLDIIGRFDPATDPDGIRRDHLLDRLKDLKAADLSKGGERVGRDGVTIDAGEYPALLARVYDDTKLPDKPRNVIGLAKTIPTDEMEKLLLANITLAADDPRWLAEARADVVRHTLVEAGKVASSRLFLVTPKLNADGITDRGAPNRVDFVLR